MRIAKKCYKFDENLGQCKKDGYDHVGPLVLQAIPVTGVFGAGFGNMGRWDLFGIYMSVLLGGCSFIVLTSVICACCCNSGRRFPLPRVVKQQYVGHIVVDVYGQ